MWPPAAVDPDRKYTWNSTEGWIEPAENYVRGHSRLTPNLADIQGKSEKQESLTGHQAPYIYTNSLVPLIDCTPQ